MMGILQLNLVLLWIVMGLLAARLAKKRSRNPIIWFLIGLFLSFLGVLIIFLLPPLPIKHSSPQPSQRPQNQEIWMKVWYYLDPTHQQQGPFEFPDLAKLHRENQISDNSLIWGEGMKEWKRLAELPDLIQEMRTHISRIGGGNG